MLIETYLVKDTTRPFFLILSQAKAPLDEYIPKTQIRILDFFNITRSSLSLLRLINSKTPKETSLRKARPSILVLSIPLPSSSALVVSCTISTISMKQIKELTEISGLPQRASSNKHW